MYFKVRFASTLLIVALLLRAGVAYADEKNLLPKYGNLPKNQAEQQADAVFITGMIEDYHGDRGEASSFMSGRGWQYLQQGDYDDAMRRFNQAWLLDPKNGTALWGMAAVEASRRKLDESLKLFAEAETYIGTNLNFSIDFAKATGMTAVQQSDDKLFEDAASRFQRIYQQAPDNTLNLENWAMTLMGKQRYAEAWAKVKLAEKAHSSRPIDPRAVAALQSKMARPPD